MRTILALGVFAAMLFYSLSDSVEQRAAANVRTLQRQTALDAARQYRIVETRGTALDRCVQAGYVAVAFLQAEDAVEYADWKATEKADCKAAGTPVFENPPTP